jgi:hypothetical protein
MMRSGWFWGTDRWIQYQHSYHGGIPQPIYRSSPLLTDHDFSDGWQDFTIAERQTRVIDLTTGLKLRKSYKSLVNQGRKRFIVRLENDIGILHHLHRLSAERETRPQDTWDMMGEWILDECGMLLAAYLPGEEFMPPTLVAAAYFIVWRKGAYYACSAQKQANAMHPLIVEATEYLSGIGVTNLEMGDVGWLTEKEFGIMTFKTGFGGVDEPYLLATRRIV